MCDSPPVADDARELCGRRAAGVPDPDGQWQLQVQVLHWRGDDRPGGRRPRVTFETAGPALRNCQRRAPLSSPSITTDQLERIAAVISGLAGGQVMHEYLLADPRQQHPGRAGHVVVAPPLVDWPAVPDAQVLDAMAAPLCNAYLGSCR